MLKRLHRCIAFALLAAFWHTPSFSAPKLVVVISIDQFRYEYLVKFREYYGTHGFRYLMEHGANFTNASYKHALNKTAPGHAVIMTGTYSDINGIIANSWFDPVAQKDVYCVGDRNVSLLGSNGDGKSPANLLVPTFGDQLRLHTGFASKVVSIANKDRSAILMPSVAVWMSDTLFTTSTYYVKELPAWVSKFNASGLVNSYRGKPWNSILPDEAFRYADADDVPYEANHNGVGRTFPHIIGGDNTRTYGYAMLTSPFGMEALSEIVKSALKDEHLGGRGVTDLLCIGYSSTDYVGHDFGPDSREVVEIAVQTDRIIADMLKYLDEQVGLANTIVVLTSDHGVTPIPEYLLAKYPGVDAGRISKGEFLGFCDRVLNNAFGTAPQGKSWVRRIIDMNIYLDSEQLQEKSIEPDRMANTLADSLLRFQPVALALSRRDILLHQPVSLIAEKMARNYHPARSGDVVVALKPYFALDDEAAGAEHGSPYEHDAHVPLIIMGEGIRSGTYASDASPADIAPTLSSLVGVEFPAGKEGRILIEALKNP